MALDSKKRAAILSVISKRGQNPVQGDIYTQMANWKSWYRGNVNDFHRYSIKDVNGVSKDCKRSSMQMAKKVCEDWTTLLWNEKVEITVNDTDINEQVKSVLKDNNFLIEYANIVEKTMALGTGAMVEFLVDNEIVIDFIIGDLLIVTSYRNQQIFGICSINVSTRNDEVVTHLTYHDMSKDEYTIEHQVFVSKDSATLGKSAPLNYVFEDSDIEAMGMLDNAEFVTDDAGNILGVKITYQTDVAHFQILKPNLVNNFDLENPMGISVFANSIDTLASIDIIDDEHTEDYTLAKHRIIADASVTKEMQKATEEGVIRFSVFDTNDPVFIGANLQSQEKAIEIYSADLRTDQYVSGTNFKLQTLAFKCGMGTDYYAFDARGVYQNEKAIVSENSDLWASKKKHEQTMIIKPLTDLVKAILYLLRETGEIVGDINMLDINIKPDDSVIIDDEALYMKDLDKVDRGMMAKWQVLVKWDGLTEEEAKAQILASETEGIVEESNKPTPNEGETLEDFINRFMTNMEMIEEYPNEDTRREIAEESYNNNGS